MGVLELFGIIGVSLFLIIGFFNEDKFIEFEDNLIKEIKEANKKEGIKH